ncbi:MULTISPECIES: 4-alpha-glucanotransferase [unclassified Thioalkalivibrio]|uniref:4-alpha-glucanotransferase n=1 Tax=unclassified Thioalkalivibrio TaxID=2621013 RepID=UPI0003780D3F|nr:MULTISPECIES: 4-alpha-glucanotransferase [unclassified Thioalkalivibrio]
MVGEGHANPLMQRRRAGVLLHPTSLPGSEPVGTLGGEAYAFLDWARRAGFTLWQILPLHPPHEDGSPYACISAFAGDVRLIDPRLLAERVGLSADSGTGEAMLARAHARLNDTPAVWREAYQRFCQEQGPVWLDDYARFVVVRAREEGRPWWEWTPALRDRDPDAMERIEDAARDELERVRFAQFVFFDQWQDLRRQAKDLDILILGDMPIFVAHDSADVWAHRDLFDLDETGHPITVAGVPPDYFSETGQRWGNPQYHWDRLEATGYRWWVERMRWALETLDAVRIDHFRGFEASWGIPAEEPDATSGRWVPGPGEPFFRRLEDELGTLPLLAEDLGVITPEVTALREHFDLPGMRILQFAFEGGEDNPYLPNNHDEASAVYTGTHDNDTTLGWFHSLSPEMQAHVINTLNEGGAEEMPWPLMRAAYRSVAQLAIVPMQDALALDTRARMNRPGTMDDGNWRWRFSWKQVPEDRAAELQALARETDRL